MQTFFSVKKFYFQSWGNDTSKSASFFMYEWYLVLWIEYILLKKDNKVIIKLIIYVYSSLQFLKIYVDMTMMCLNVKKKI